MKRILAAVLGAGVVVFCGCVERTLTINTEPSGALVILNDEQIGQSPVTVGFNWYGDYNVRIRKEGYETLETHRKLEGPWYDKFPFDFFAMLSPRTIVNEYEWEFDLEQRQAVERGQLLEQAERMREQF